MVTSLVQPQKQGGKSTDASVDLGQKFTIYQWLSQNKII